MDRMEVSVLFRGINSLKFKIQDTGFFIFCICFGVIKCNEISIITEMMSDHYNDGFQSK